MLKQGSRLAEEVVCHVQKVLGEKFNVVSRDVTKNNGEVLTGVCILEEENRVSPTIYLEQYERDYEDGIVTAEGIGDRVIEVYKSSVSNMDNSGIQKIMNIMADRDSFLNNVVPMLVNREQNGALLSECPNMDFLDLSVMYCVRVNDIDRGMMTVRVTNEHIRHLGIEFGELDDHAVRNYRSTIVHSPIRDMLDSLVPEGARSIPDDGDISSVMVLTNADKYYGAYSMTCADVLNGFMDKAGSDALYIIPSSIHEVIVFPRMSSAVGLEEMLSLIFQVNMSCLESGEVLSYKLYRYTKEKGYDIVSR